MTLVAGKETRFCSPRRLCPALAVTQQPLGSGQEFDSVLVSPAEKCRCPGLTSGDSHSAFSANRACRGLRHAAGPQEAAGDSLVGF